jgi:glycosyltransferase involved in cell wall biosynthesis
MTARRLRVAILCPGLGHVARGFESFARECFDALRAEGSLDVTLVKGAGPSAAGERTAWAVRRGSRVAWAWNRLTERTDPYVLEQVTFAAGALPLLARSRPDVVLFSDRELGLVLARLRAVLPGRPRLAFSNGGPAPGPFGHLDRVAHVTPVTRAQALAAGEPAERHVVLPYGVDMPAAPVPLAPLERAALRRSLGLPADRPVVLSVAALDARFKRLDSIVHEVAALEREDRPHLVLLGQETAETPALRALARERLGEAGHTIRTVPAGEVAAFYRAADAFVLASLREGFGRVLVEACAHGLPCLAHSGPAQRFVLGALDPRLDLSRRGTLARALRATLAEPASPDAARRRHAVVRERFGWEGLAPRYADFLREAAGARHAVGAADPDLRPAPLAGGPVASREATGGPARPSPAGAAR